MAHVDAVEALRESDVRFRVVGNQQALALYVAVGFMGV